MNQNKPTNIAWELTSNCNLLCKHCYNSVPVKRGIDLDLKKQLEICDELASNGVKSIFLTGGELFMYKHWVDVASKLVKLGINVSVMSNGLLVSSKIIKKLETIGVTSIGLSLDGLQSNNDLIRGNGTYKKVIKAIELMI